MKAFPVLLLAISLSGSARASGQFVQSNSVKVPAASATVSFIANTTAGNLILLGFDFTSNAVVSSVWDSDGNQLLPIGNKLTTPGAWSSRLYYGKKIKGGPDTLKVTFSKLPTSTVEMYICEYSGIDPTNPIDGQTGESGTAGPVTSGPANSTAVGDIIFGYCIGDLACTYGSGFTPRLTLDGNLIEDQTAGNVGSQSATATANSGWAMQMALLKPNGSTMHAVTINWTLSQAPGVTGYNLFRGTASGGESATPLNLAPIMPPFVDTTVLPGVTYYYYTEPVTANGAPGAASAEITATVP